MARPPIQLALQAFEAGNFRQCMALLAPEGRVLSEDAQVLGLYGASLCMTDEPGSAIRFLIRAAKKSPREAWWHYYLGASQYKLGKFADALGSYSRAAELLPSAEFITALANTSVQLSRFSEAVSLYRQALSLDASSLEIVDNLGRLYCRLGSYREAVPLLKRAVEIDDQSSDTWFLLSVALWYTEQYPDGLKAITRALELEPTHRAAKLQWISYKHEICDWSTLDADLSFLRESVEKDQVVPPLVLTSRFDDPALLRDAAAVAAKKIEAREPFKRERTAGKAMPEKWRLLYVSADFRNHAAARLVRGLLAGHDRVRFHITAASIGPNDNSDVRQSIVDAVDDFIDVAGLDTAQLISRLRAVNAALAVDLMGHTQGARPEVFAARVAPVQVSFLGYAGTTAIKNIDYLIADPHVVTPATRELFTEALLVMPRTYYPTDAEQLKLRTASGSGGEHFRFCCLNGSRKYTPEVFDLWADIMQRVPNAHLTLFGDSRLAASNIQREAERRGFSDRLSIIGRAPYVDHVRRYLSFDCALDTFPYGSHTTAVDALSMGCPLVALSGSTYASRVSGSLLRAIGLPELVATSRREYVDLAVRLAVDTQFATSVRERLQQQQLCSNLFNTPLFTLELERGYELAIEKARSGSPPADIAIDLSAAL